MLRRSDRRPRDRPPPCLSADARHPPINCNRSLNSRTRRGEFMTKPQTGRRLARGIRNALLATSLLAATPAFAQLTTATIRGQVTTSAAAAPGAVVTAKNIDNGSTATATAGPDGSYVLTGLRPGTYDISFAAAGGATVSRRVIVSVGQTATLDVDTGA